jgi:hypothetical protein
VTEINEVAQASFTFIYNHDARFHQDKVVSVPFERTRMPEQANEFFSIRIIDGHLPTYTGIEVGL